MKCKSIDILSVIILLILSLGLLLPATETSIPSVSELENQLKTAQGKDKIDILLKLSGYSYGSKPKKCIEYCNEIIQLSTRYNVPLKKAEALIFLSYAHSILGEREKPFQYGQEALKIYSDFQDQPGMARSFNLLGYMYMKIDYYNIALEYLLKGLEIAENMDNINERYGFYWTLGSLYNNMEEYRRSMEYYRKALEVAETLNIPIMKASCLHNIGLCYQWLEDYDTALPYFQQALEIFRKSNQQYWIGACLSNMGNVYGHLKKFPSALKALNDALEIRSQMGNTEGLFWTLFYTGEVYLSTKDFPQSLHFHQKALAIATQLEDKNLLERLYKSFAQHFAAQNKYADAFQYYKKYSDIREQLFTKAKNRQAAEMQIKFETQKKNNQIQLLKKNNKIQQITRNTFILGFLMLLIILGLLFKKYLFLLAFWKKQKYIGQYRLLEKIGSGGSGTIYRACSVNDKTRVTAVKILNDEVAADENNRQRFMLEGNITDRLKHPNIVKIYERGEEKGVLFIALEYLEGVTLAEKLKTGGPLSIHPCLFIMIQVTEALVFVHNNKVIHRDVKPSNIMLLPKTEPFTEVKLLDFGVAMTKSQTRLTQSGYLVCTIHYSAPEQITENLYSPASDIYALGVTFYEMLVGNTIFHEDTITTVVDKILGQPPKAPIESRPDIPGRLNGLIMNMMAKEPEKRPSAPEVLEELKVIQKKL